MGTRNIAVLTGSRGEWGYIRPVLKLIDQDPELDYSLIVTNMHLLPEFGMTVHEIERDGFEIAERLYMTFDGYTATTMTKSLGVLLMELPTVLRRVKPDLLLLAGDRGEQLMGAIAGSHLGIPVAHIQAGEVSGNVDGVVRHAITKLAHLHFAANEEFADRVRKLGEQEFRIHQTGAPLVDELINCEIADKEEITSKYHLNSSSPFLLSVQHPVTEEENAAGVQIQETIDALVEINLPTILIFPNSDAGSDLVRKRLEKIQSNKIRLFRSLPRRDYLGMMAMAKAMVGNSSSGIMETPSFGTPVVNIGRRQKDRPQACNVINVGYQKKQILAALEQAMSTDFVTKAKKAKNPYGDGKASERIVSILKTIEITPHLLNKEMTY